MKYIQEYVYGQDWATVKIDLWPHIPKSMNTTSQMIIHPRSFILAF